MFSPAAQGFGRVAANTGLNALGSATGRNYERNLQLGGTALRGKAAIEAAKARGRAIEYAGRQAGNAAIFGGLMDGIGSVMTAGIGKGWFKGKAPATQGIGPVADGATYGGYLDSMQGIGGMGPVASGSTYGAFLNSPSGYGGYNVDLKFKPPASMNSGYFGGF